MNSTNLHSDLVRRLRGSAGHPARPPFRLRILHFNDLHGRLADVDERGSAPIFSRIAAAIARSRAACAAEAHAGLLVLAAGDDLVGSPFAELQGCRPANFCCHPAYRVYTAAGVDAAVIGNHDLDWGLDMLALSARCDAAFPLLSANLIPAGPLSPEIAAFARFDVRGRDGGGVRVGVIGVTTPGEIKHLHRGEFTLADPIAAVQDQVSVLRQQCEVLIVLSHLGYSLATPEAAVHRIGNHPCGTAALVIGAGDVELAAALPAGVAHLIIGGHSHTVLNPGGLEERNVVNGTAIVQAGANAGYLGEVLIEVVDGKVTVADARLHSISDLASDDAFETAHVLPLVAQVQHMLNEPLGVVAAHGDLDPARVREAFGSEESALANFVADALVERCRVAGMSVDFAMVDASTLCDGLPQGGVLTFGDLFRLAPHADSIVLHRLTPVQLQALLDDNARRADRLDEPRMERGFLQFSREVRYTIMPGPTRSQAHAVRMTQGGVPIEALVMGRTQPFMVACSSFVRELAAAWERRGEESWQPWALRALPVEHTGLSLREELLAFVRAHGGVTVVSGLVRDGRLGFSSRAVSSGTCQD